MNTYRRSIFVALFFLILAVGPSASGTRPATQAPAGASGIQAYVEFLAVTADGEPVLNLAASDVTLKVGGRVRDVRSLELVPPVRKPASAARGVVPPPFATNAATSTGRDTLIVVDNESIEPGAEDPVRDAITQFLNSRFAGDRVGAMTVQSTDLRIALTDQIAAVREGVSKMTGRGRRTETSDDFGCRTRRNLDTLSTIFRSVVGGPPLTVVFFSSGMAAPGAETVMNTMSNTRGNTGTTECLVQTMHFQEVETAVKAAPVNLYVVGASAAGTGAQAAGLEHLAGLAGNRLIALTGSGGIARVIRETTATYRAAFEPDATERDGSSKRVELQVRRPGVDVKVRPNVSMPRATGKPSAKTPPIKDLLRESRAYRDIELRAAAFASREPGSEKVRLVVLFEPLDPAVELKSAVVGLYDGKGKLVVQGSAEPANLSRRPPTLVVLVAPGTYRMRLAAADASGRAGAVDSDVSARLIPAETLQMASLVLGVAEAGSFAGRLMFSNEALVVGYLEVYGVPKTSNVSAVVDAAESEDGPAVAQGSTRIAGGAEDRRIILGGVSLAQLPPGDIVVRMVVHLDGKPVGRVVRTLRKADR